MSSLDISTNGENWNGWLKAAAKTQLLNKFIKLML